MAEFDLTTKEINTQVQYKKSEDIVQDIREIIDSAQNYAYRAVNVALVFRNWLVGKRISEEELKGDRAKYGAKLIKKISSELTKDYGKGFTRSSVYRFVQFYEAFPDIFASSGR